jgi:hypothetical protein
MPVPHHTHSGGGSGPKLNPEDCLVQGSLTPLFLRAVKKTDTYTVQESDRVVLLDSSGGAFTVTLPAATGSGRVLIFKMVGTGVNAVTLDGADSETIDGAATDADMDAQYDVIIIVDGEAGKWSILQKIQN